MTHDEAKALGATHYDNNDCEYMRYNGEMSWHVLKGCCWNPCIVDIDYVIENFEIL